MLNGLYSSATALDVIAQQQEAIASNLAHANTPGHRRLMTTFVERLHPHDATRPLPGTRIEHQLADFTEGRMQPTGRSLDLAIRGDAFFAYQGAGGTMYSRNGVIHRDPESNLLINGDGFSLLDDSNQPITFSGDLSALTVGSDGTLSADGQSVGKIGLFSFDDNYLLESENQTYFRAGRAVAAPATEAGILQGIRELSNVNPITELVALITGSRSFEASQRAIRLISESLQEHTKS